MGKLILVRHGHNGLNQPGPDEGLRAWLDVPLDQQGLPLIRSKPFTVRTYVGHPRDRTPRRPAKRLRPLYTAQISLQTRERMPVDTV
jgi:hypothetical protein